MTWVFLAGPPVAADPAACWFRDGVHVFALDSRHSIMHTRRTETWSDWQSLGEDIFEYGPVACQGLGQLHVFAVGWDNGTYCNSTDDGWTWEGWRSLGGWIQAAPAVLGAADRLDVFGRGFDNGAWHNYLLAGADKWSNWYGLGGAHTSNPVITYSGSSPCRLELFHRSGDRALWQASYDGSQWTEWHWWAGQLCSEPAAASWNDLRVDVVARTLGNHLWHKGREGRGQRFHEEVVESRQILSKPALLARGRGGLYVLARDLEGTICYARSSPDGFLETWNPIPGGPFLGDPVFAHHEALGDRPIDLFARGFDSVLYHTQV